MRFRLDTTVLIEASRHREPALSWLREALRTPDEVGVCAVIVAEFFAGLQPDERPRWESFIDDLTYWATTPEVARHTGIYRYEYARRGQTILTADALIAATAAAVGATPVTDNAKHFPMPEIKTMRLVRLAIRLGAGKLPVRPAHGPAIASRMDRGRPAARRRSRGSSAATSSPSNTAAPEPPADGNHRRAPEKEGKIPPGPLVLGNGFVDMMDTEQKMIDDSLDDIEQAPAEER
jgi:tRNA(fMet)-specific endonuclease VapC